MLIDEVDTKGKVPKIIIWDSRLIFWTRDNPGDALVLKQKYNPEKNGKMVILEYFSTGAKIMGNNSKFYFNLLETSG